jgi:hypothetical protein
MTLNSPEWTGNPFFIALSQLDVSHIIGNVNVITAIQATELRLEDMQSDIDRLAHSVALHYTDDSCVFLHTDELVGECKAALANVIHKQWLTKARTRGVFFRVLKTSMCNRMRSLVQQYRFTQKRTGIKPPPKHQRNVDFKSYKPNEISLDDPDAHLQVGEDERGVHESDMDAEELKREIYNHLPLGLDDNGAPVRLVFTELIEPSLNSFVIAQLDAYRGLKNYDRMKVRVSHAHRAQALNISIELFEKAVLQIQQVTERLREMNPEDQRYDQILGLLSEAFSVQVPRNLQPMLVRRMFTIAARDNWQKVTPEVEEALSEIGAVAPKFDKDSMRCHGILYQRGHKICESCGVKVSCAAQAANIGLGEITIHPKLLGAKLTRTPFILPAASAAVPLTTTEREQNIVDYLFRNFRHVTHQGELYFQPKDFQDKSKLIFSIGVSSIPLRLRFCKPNPLLKRRLVYVNKGYYAPDSMPAEAVIELINEHARFAYEMA